MLDFFGGKMKINETKYGFTLVDLHEVPEIKSQAYVMEHTSGAKLLYLKNDDDNKVFSVAFRTPPNDSTGVPHIIEHCVLSGSRKYKTKEPFMDMVKGSLKTFINAMTFSDKTIYPVASKNEKDFKNLMDVYLDSVFFPMIAEDPTIFMQEGWHYSIEHEDAPINYNGVVYNEMRGAYSQPTSQLREVIGRSLFPDTTYQYSSGGNPDHITDLTYENFLKFHEDYYHPSNAYIYIYGDMSIETYLEHMDQEYLSSFKAKTIDSTINKQDGFSQVKYLKDYYGISKDDSEDHKAYFSMNYVIGDGQDPKVHMMGEVLKEVLVNSAAGPIKKALMDAGIGEDIMCSFGGGRQLYLSIIAKNANGDQAQAFENIINETLMSLIKDGIDKDLIESSINIAEYDMREATGFATKGIIYHILSMNAWLYDGHPTDMIRYDDVIKEMRDYVKTDFFEKLIEEKMINNTHVSLVSLLGKKGLNEEKSEKVTRDLEAYKKSLSKEDLEALIEANQTLKEKQLSKDSEEALATIPKLEVSDVNKSVEALPIEVIEEDVKILKHSIFSNDITYVDFIFDSRNIQKEDLSYLGLLSDILLQMDTKSYTYGDLNNLVYKETGGISFANRIYSNHVSDEYFPKMVVSSKALSNKLEDLMTLTHTILTETIFTDEKRLKELLMQIKSRLEMSINSRGDNYASQRLASYYRAPSYHNEMTKGFEYYWQVCAWLENFDTVKDTIIKKLENVYETVFNRHNLIISFTGDDKSYDAFSKVYKKAIHSIEAIAFKPAVYDFVLEKKNEGITSSSNVQYVAMGYNFKALDYKYHGSMQVMKSILASDYLHDHIRAKGGAYGTNISFTSAGNVIATSYRDPNLEETIQVFKEIHTFIDAMDDMDLTKFVIGAISRLDGALTAKGKGVLSTANYISGLTLDMLQKERDELLNVTLEDLKSLSKLVEEVMAKAYYCVYGNESKINDSDLFDHIRKLNP